MKKRPSKITVILDDNKDDHSCKIASEKWKISVDIFSHKIVENILV